MRKRTIGDIIENRSEGLSRENLLDLSKKLLKENELYYELFEKLDDGILLLDGEKVVFSNKMAQYFLNISNKTISFEELKENIDVLHHTKTKKLLFLKGRHLEITSFPFDKYLLLIIKDYDSYFHIYNMLKEQIDKFSEVTKIITAEIDDFLNEESLFFEYLKDNYGVSVEYGQKLLFEMDKFINKFYNGIREFHFAKFDIVELFSNVLSFLNIDKKLNVNVPVFVYANKEMSYKFFVELISQIKDSNWDFTFEISEKDVYIIFTIEATDTFFKIEEFYKELIVFHNGELTISEYKNKVIVKFTLPLYFERKALVNNE